MRIKPTEQNAPSETSSVAPPPHYNRSTHTFTRKPSIWQIITYILISGQIVVYFICIHIPLLEMEYYWLMTGVYIAITLLMIISTVVTSCVDPTDPTVYKYKWHKYHQNYSISQQKDFKLNHSEQFYCQHCQSFCKNNSKHCRTCDRCVINFDHHCIWINNCIGQKNYRWFVSMIVITFMHMTSFLVIGVVATINFAEQSRTVDIGFMIPIWIIMLIESILNFLLLILIILHFYLIFQGKTTYQYLQERVSRKKTNENIEQQNKEIKQFEESMQRERQKLKNIYNSMHNIKDSSDKSNDVLMNQMEKEPEISVKISKKEKSKIKKAEKESQEIREDGETQGKIAPTRINLQEKVGHKPMSISEEEGQMQEYYIKPSKKKLRNRNDRSRTTNQTLKDPSHSLQNQPRNKVQSQHFSNEQKINPSSRRSIEYLIGFSQAVSPKKSNKTIKRFD